MPKAGEIKLNLNLTPTQKSIKLINKTFEKAGQAFLKPLKGVGKLFGGKQALAGAGGSVLGSIFQKAQQEFTKPLEALTKVLSTQAGLQTQGRQLGISASRQFNLEKYLTQVGLGGDLGKQVESSFSNFLQNATVQERGFLKKKAGIDPSKGIDEQLQKFIAFLSKQDVGTQSLLSKQVLGAEAANALFEARKYRPKGFEKRAGRSDILGEDKGLDRQIFFTQQQQQLKDLEKKGLFAQKRVSTGTVSAGADIGISEDKKSLVGLTEQRIKAISDTTKAVNAGFSQLNKGIEKLIGFVREIVENPKKIFSFLNPFR